MLVLLVYFEMNFDDFVGFEWVMSWAEDVLAVKHLKSVVLLFDLVGLKMVFWEHLGQDSIEHFH